MAAGLPSVRFLDELHQYRKAAIVWKNRFEMLKAHTGSAAREIGLGVQQTSEDRGFYGPDGTWVT